MTNGALHAPQEQRRLERKQSWPKIEADRKKESEVESGRRENDTAGQSLILSSAMKPFFSPNDEVLQCSTEGRLAQRRTICPFD